uniref:Ribonuclease H-like domain-containing protein n=1 Tax=Tanacetum cinerariifolium TaxID=118510 RepID=A0A6L2NJR8_TANCI|nr:ribonuclease H-like domain-containing protein [Tanacetum cinerariifolium]
MTIWLEDGLKDQDQSVETMFGKLVTSSESDGGYVWKFVMPDHSMEPTGFNIHRRALLKGKKLHIVENIQETVGMQEHEKPTLTEVEEPTLTEVPEKYVLLARTNRRIPSKRYTLEKVSRSSKYPIANIARGNLSKEAKAFFASLYSEEAPSNVEQALKSEK